MKLNISHLAPYLPYGLKVQCRDLGILELTSISTKDKDYPCWFESTLDYFNRDFNYDILSRNSLSGKGFRLTEIKPLLLPMSSLYTEMEDGTVHIVELAKKHIEYDEEKGDYDFKLESCFARQIRLDITWMHTAYSEPLYDDRLFIQTQRTHLNPYWVNEYLFSHHFDVFSLIDKGLAIDKTKIK